MVERCDILVQQIITPLFELPQGFCQFILIHRHSLHSAFIFYISRTSELQNGHEPKFVTAATGSFSFFPQQSNSMISISGGSGPWIGRTGPTPRARLNS